MTLWRDACGARLRPSSQFTDMPPLRETVPYLGAINAGQRGLICLSDVLSGVAMIAFVMLMCSPFLDCVDMTALIKHSCIVLVYKCRCFHSGNAPTN